MAWKKTSSVPIKPDEFRPPDFRRQDGVLAWNLDESPTQLVWMPSAGWRLLVVTAKTPIYASLPEGELFKLIKTYGLRGRAPRAPGTAVERKPRGGGCR